jgi:anti-sigma factor RsiW
MRHMAEALRALAPLPATPVAVRVRVARALAQTSVPEVSPPVTVRRRQWWSVALAVCALGLGVLSWWMHGTPPDSARQSPLHAVTEDHIRALHEEQMLSADPTTVARWMAQRVAFAVHVPAMPGASLVGGRLCLLHGQRGMVLWYRVDGHLLSYYVMPGAPHTISDPAEGILRHGAEAGYRVVAWWAEGLFHALVGDLSDERLRALARVCAPRLAEAMPADDALTLTPVPERQDP